MSLFQTATVACPSCSAMVPFDVVQSVNADRRPDLRDDILHNRFQRETCSECGHAFRLEPEMTYLDEGRKQWLLVQPAQNVARWIELEVQAQKSFEQAYGSRAPAIMQQLGKELSARVTFGWAALREKILAAASDLDDRVLEVVKIALVRGLDDSPISDTTELRLVEVQPQILVMAWIDAAKETAIEVLQVPRSLYDDVAAGAGWKPLVEEVSAGAYVDMNRLLVPTTAGEGE